MSRSLLCLSLAQAGDEAHSPADSVTLFHSYLQICCNVPVKAGKKKAVS